MQDGLCRKEQDIPESKGNIQALYLPDKILFPGGIRMIQKPGDQEEKWHVHLVHIAHTRTACMCPDDQYDADAFGDI